MQQRACMRCSVGTGRSLQAPAARLLQHPHRCISIHRAARSSSNAMMHQGDALYAKQPPARPTAGQHSTRDPAKRHGGNKLEQARIQDVNQAFAVAGMLPDMPITLATALQVEGFDATLAIPLFPEQVDGLLALSQPAPFGLNADTVLDPAVRKAQQIDAARVETDVVWQEQLKKLTGRVSEELGIDPQVTVEARPYKLLMYTEGGHFKAHKDTEKEAGMFGTLVVQLPVLGGHEGGTLVFRHHGKTHEWQTNSSSSTTFQYAACYADVEHELQPITSGTCVVMVYNLVRTGSRAIPKALDPSPITQQLQQASACWGKDLANGKAGTPRFLVVALEHQYTSSSLSFSALKGTDAQMVGCLTHPDCGLDVHLALLSRTETRGDGTFANSYENTSYYVESCISAAGTTPSHEVMESIGMLKRTYMKEVPVPQLLGGGQVPIWGDDWVEEEDEEEEEGDRDGDGDGDGAGQCAQGNKRAPRNLISRVHTPWMGNEGCSIDKIYHDTVVIIWPRAQACAAVGYSLEAATYLLQMRHAQGKADEVAAAVQHMVSLFVDPLSEEQLNTYKRPLKHLGYQAFIVQALQAISSLDDAMAVPAVATVIAHLPTVGDSKAWNDTAGDRLRQAIVDTIMRHGEPAKLLAATTTLVSRHAATTTLECIQLAAVAEVNSQELGNTVTDAVLSATLLAPRAQQVLSGMSPECVCALSVLLCKVSRYQQHLDKLASIILALSDPQPVLAELAASTTIQASAGCAPTPFKLLAEARQKHLKQLIKPDPAFTWEMRKASVPAYPEVEAFLQGAESKMVHTCTSYTEAQSLIQDHFTNTSQYSSSWGEDTRGMYGWNLSRYGSGRKQKLSPTYTATAAYNYTNQVTITKSRSWYEHLLKTHQEEQKKVQDDLAHVGRLLEATEDSPAKPVTQQNRGGRGRGRGKGQGRGVKKV